MTSSSSIPPNSSKAEAHFLGDNARTSGAATTPGSALERDLTMKLTIEKLIAGGDGLARAEDGRVVFVDGALPGETVEVEVTEERSDYLRAGVTSIVSASAARVEPPCPHVARGCGGCGWQHVAPDQQTEFKAQIVAEALERMGKVKSPDVKIGPILPFGAFRTTIRVGVVDGKLGFRKAQSNDIVPVDSCDVAHPLLQDLLTTVDPGEAQELTLRVGAATGERLILAAPSAEGVVAPDDVLVTGADEIQQAHEEGRLLDTDAVVAAIHDVVAGRTWRISADSFFQARPDGAEALVEAVGEATGPLKGRTVIDAYGGVGLFAGTVAAQSRVTLLESSRSAVADAKVNLSDVDVRVIRRDVARWVPRQADIVIADPPRKGLGAQAGKRLIDTACRRLVLVSCDVGSLGRDTRWLKARGFVFQGATVIDMFTHTPHIEVVSIFDRR